QRGALRRSFFVGWTVRAGQTDGVTRDVLLSRLCGQPWPFDPLLGALQLAPTQDVPDIGEGDGALLARLRGRGHTGVLRGLDPQPAPGVQAGRAEHLPFPDASFDVVFLIRTLLHVASPAQALAQHLEGAAAAVNLTDDGVVVGVGGVA
ncbi:methyltransferase domain-containing protein, partial [Deinococcus sp.]|uniref:class I SAM-dependent methyltransferase n=1 Tax=Deinococcus sp. TaxID=47478 RepID=UPI0025DF4C8D